MADRGAEAKRIAETDGQNGMKAASASEYDALLKTALSEELEQEQERETEAEAAHIFSRAFETQIRELIARADDIAAGNADTVSFGNSDVKSQKNQREEKHVRQAEVAVAGLASGQTSEQTFVHRAREAQRTKARAAQMRQLEWLRLHRGRRVLMNAASLLLIFGLSIFALQQLDRHPAAGSHDAAVAAVTGGETEQEAAAAGASLRAAAEAPADSGSPATEAAAGMGRAAAPRTFRAEDSAAALANPVQEVADADAFETALGFSLTAEDRTHTALRYSVISGSIAQIQYYSSTLQSNATLRAARATETLTDGSEIAGIYEGFDPAKETELETEKDGQSVQVKLQFVKTAGPDEAGGALATWKSGDLVYSLWVENAVYAPDAVGTEALRLIKQQT